LREELPLLITSMGDWLEDMIAPVSDLFRTLTFHYVLAGNSSHLVH
jgi:hypothetical protein